jgi:5-hydroxyisourate hydrolase
MASLSTHVLDAAGGGARPGVRVTVSGPDGQSIAQATTDEGGRIASLATGLGPGDYELSFELADVFPRSFLRRVSVTVGLVEDRHYHVPLLASPWAIVSYLGT